MAISSASGWTNLSNGNFSPVIYSKKIQKQLRKSSVIQDITNTDFFGNIDSMGDTVKIIKEPDITITALERGTALSTQALADADFTLVIDQANYFQFALDDIEAQMAHLNWIELASDKAAYSLKDAYDSECLGYLTGWTGGAGSWARRSTQSGTKANSTAGADELLAANSLDITDFGGSELAGSADAAGNSGSAGEATAIPLQSDGGSGAITSPLELVNRMARLMDVQNVEMEGRYFVADPVFYEMLMDENSKFINNDYTSSGTDVMMNGKVTNGLIRGFRMYKSNNLPYIGNGPSNISNTGSEHSFGVVVAGHDSAVATATQINKVETFRSPTQFSDIVRGMNLYGRKILRPEALITACYNKAV